MKRLRAAAGLVFGLAIAGTALGQNTTLAINGVSSSDNSASVNVTVNSTMTITLANTAQASRTYGLFAALANTGASNGWYLLVNGLGKKPFPITTGIATSIIEANYSTDISPDRQSSPLIHLDATGHASLSFAIPSTAVGKTFYFQAAVLKSGSSTQTDLSNAVTVTVTQPTTSARLAVSVATAGSPTVDHAQFGILSFNNGDPTSGSFTPDATLTDIKVDQIALADSHPWALHSANGASNNRRARDYDWASGTMAAYNPDNYEYGRVELPAAAGLDGVFGTSDDIPPRSVMRCYDNVSQEGFFLIVNKGPNPNTPGVDYIVLGRKKDGTTPTQNSWKILVSTSPDGTRMSAIYDDSALAVTPQMFLIATDGTTPYADAGGNPTAVLDVTPPTTANIYVKGQVFTNNRLWFIKDDGASPAVRTLWTVNIRAPQPTSAQVSIPINGNYGSHVVKVVLDRSLVVKRSGGGTLCFVAGDTDNVASGLTPENVTFGDWYAVTEARPTAAVNVTGFPLYGPSSNLPVKVYGSGETNNGQSGYASLSSDETALAIAVNHQNETPSLDADEIYIYHTADSNGDGLGDDAGSTTFANPITKNSNIDSRGESNTLKVSCDLYLADPTHLFFWYGKWTTQTNKLTDLFYWDATNSLLTNVTKTGDTTLPITTKGNIYPEGYFPSPNGKYLIWSRSSEIGTGQPRQNQANLVALDTTNGSLVNVTGDEFAGTKTSNTDNPNATFGENFDWHLSFAGGLYPSLCYFGAPISLASGNPRNPWVFDANFPTAAIKLTADNTANQTIESLTASPYTLGCAWAWCSTGVTNKSDMEYQDLLYFFRDDLTQTSRTGNMALGQFVWLRPGTSTDSTGVAPAALLAGYGDAPSGTADNPTNGKFYFFSINGTSDYNFKGTTGVDAPGHTIGTTTGIIQIWAVSKP